MCPETWTPEVRIRPGERLGHYRVEELLGRGGMSEVYAAWDEKLERRVALKLIRADLDHGSERRERLLREARILSRLRHPGVCTVYDVLSGDFGDVLVMERADGRGLEELDLGQINHRKRLDIAIQIADALAAAHRLGIVHRDLKLGNLVLESSGQVRILDFGLARLLTDGEEPPRKSSAREGAAARTNPFRTEFGSLLGTAVAMSPEQARGEPATIASDAYSFGLVLQELLSGESPYEAGLTMSQLLSRAAVGGARPVRGVSSKLRWLIEDLRRLAPEDRLTVAEARERLIAIRDRPRRLAWRSALVAAVLLVAFGGAKYVVDLRHERGAAVAAQRAAEHALEQVRTARRQAEEVSRFLVDLFRAADPFVQQGRETTTRELVDLGVRRVRSELGGEPLVQGRLLAALATTYRGLGDIDHAEQLAREAVDRLVEEFPERAELADALQILGSIQRERGRPEAEANLDRALALREHLLGGDDPAVAETLNDLAILRAMRADYAGARDLFERVVAIRRASLGEKHPLLARSLANLAGTEMYLGDLAEAERLLRQAIAIAETLGEGSTDLATHRTALGVLLDRQGRYAESVPLYRRARAAAIAALGEEHPRVTTIEVNLAAALDALGERDEAARLLREVVATRRRIFGREAQPTAEATVSLAEVLARQGRTREALALAEEAARAMTALGFEGPESARAADLIERIRAGG